MVLPTQHFPLFGGTRRFQSLHFDALDSADTADYLADVPGTAIQTLTERVVSLPFASFWLVDGLICSPCLDAAHQPPTILVNGHCV